MVNPSSYYNAIAALMQPGARLVLTCNPESVVGRSFCILPSGRRVSEGLAKALIRRADMQVMDTGLFPDCPQSWQLERRRFRD
jgi:hypothetical protein